MAKPGDFHIGIIEFFSIILPGAILAALLMQLPVGGALSNVLTLPAGKSVSWVVFLLSAYVLGHVIFLVGSRLDGLYDQARRRLNPYTNESSFQCATAIKEKYLQGAENDAVNTHQWAQAILSADFPALAADVHRHIADSKFFRSLLVVLVATAAYLAIVEMWWYAVVSALLVVPCAMRYYERRLKSTTRAYQYIITLYRIGRLADLKRPA